MPTVNAIKDYTEITPLKKYVVYDPKHDQKDGVEDGWVVAYYDTVGEWVAVDNNKADWKINPTHYTEYYEDTSSIYDDIIIGV